MSVSFYDLMKYAKTGIASPEMTGFDKLRARAAFGGYPVSTITGTPPISFKADGKPLTAWSIAGAMQQTGTPTPDAPITPQETGDLVESGEHAGQYAIPVTCAGQTSPIYLTEPLRKIGDYADSVSSDGTVTRRVKKYEFTGEENIIADRSYSRFRFRLIDSFSLGIRKTPIICSHYQSIADGRPIADVPDNSIYSDSDSQSGYWYIKTTDYSAADDFKAFLATQYANGTPVTVWYVLANPVTETVTAPTITTAKGANTLTVDTTLQPSGVSITGNIKAI